jgi:MSHA pilin protein MshA
MLSSSGQRPFQQGFTLIELVLVIIILGVLAAFALPKFSDLSRAAKLANLDGIAGAMRSTIAIVKSKAYASGLSPTPSNPGGAQSEYIIETEAGRFEVMFSNLCPESVAELADAIDMAEHISLQALGDLSIAIDNRYTRIGYDIRGTGAPTVNGCYVTYDSFGGAGFGPTCPVTVIDTDC